MRFAATIVFLLLGPATSTAELDLDQEVLIIPDTHNEKPYRWNVARNPRGYEFVLPEEQGKTAEAKTYTLKIASPPDMPRGDVHVFITDDDLHTFLHLKAARSGDEYRFDYRVPGPEKYRLEVVFETAKGWVNLRKDIKVGGPSAKEASDGQPGDDDYRVNVKLIPKKAYADHVVTFLYEIFHKGLPLRDLEEVGGFDMQVASWDEDLKEFVYATPKQNLGGPEVAVSIVFMRPGKHAVFGEFRHKGVVRRIESAVFVYEEPIHDESAIENLRPSD